MTFTDLSVRVPTGPPPEIVNVWKLQTFSERRSCQRRPKTLLLLELTDLLQEHFGVYLGVEISLNNTTPLGTMEVNRIITAIRWPC